MSAAASEAPRLIAVVVFPTPPFWLAMAMTFPMELTLQDFGVVFHVEQSRVVGYFVRRGYSTPWQRRGGRASSKCPHSFESADGEAVKKLESSAIPLLASLLHHCKEGWPSDSENIAKHPLIARPGWFSDESKRKTTPAALVQKISGCLNQPPRPRLSK